MFRCYDTSQVCNILLQVIYTTECLMRAFVEREVYVPCCLAGKPGKVKAKNVWIFEERPLIRLIKLGETGVERFSWSI